MSPEQVAQGIPMLIAIIALFMLLVGTWIVLGRANPNSCASTAATPKTQTETPRGTSAIGPNSDGLT